MMNDPVLRMLGLARRAGKLAFGDELVREACMEKKARWDWTLKASAHRSRKSAGAWHPMSSATTAR